MKPARRLPLPVGVWYTCATSPLRLAHGVDTSLFLVRNGDSNSRVVSSSSCVRILSAGTTRLLYRMSMDFLGWARFVPGIQKVWKGVAGQVLGEDLKLVLGQQDRLERGSDTWANPVSYDKLGECQQGPEC